MHAEIILSLTIIFLIVVFVFLVYNRKRFSEGFVSIPTSYSLYTENDSKTFDKQMYFYRDTLGDINDMLHVYGCGINIGTAPDALESLVKNSASELYIVPFNILTNNHQDINIRIYKIIEDFYEKNKRVTINGQIYVVLAQSPFYRDEKNIPIAVQYNIDDYLYQMTNVMKMNTTNIENNPIIQFNGYVIFTSYDDKGNLINDKTKRKTAILNIKKNFRQKQNLCFVSCPNHGNLPCGCASLEKPYISNCLESGRSELMSAGQKYTYAILYRVNPRFGDLMTRNILINDYEDYKWSPLSLNPIPTLDKMNIPPPTPLNITTNKPCPDNISNSGDGITLHQHCPYGGWKSMVVPPGKYTIDDLKCFGVDKDASSYQQVGGMKVKMYTDKAFKKPVTQDYITGNVNCFTKYANLNDNLQAIEIVG